MDLTSFLVELAQDGDLQRRLMEDSVGTMRERGLSQEDQDTLASGDHERIRRALDPPIDNAFLIVMCFLIRN